MSQGNFRVSARYRVRAPMAIRLAGSPESRNANLVDLGISGACVEVEDVLVAGMDADVEIKTPLLWDALQLRGQIIWARWDSDAEVFRAGIRFQHENPAILLSLLDLIKAQGFEP